MGHIVDRGLLEEVSKEFVSQPNSWENQLSKSLSKLFPYHPVPKQGIMGCHLFFCEKSNGKRGLLSGGPEERDSQSLPQLLVEQKIIRKASSSWRHSSLTFGEMSHGIWVACCRAVPTVAWVKLQSRSSPLYFKQKILDGEDG